MPMVTLHRMGDGNVYHMHVLEGGVDPGYGQGGGVDPGYGRPAWPNRPDHTLPGQGGHPSHPIAGGRPGIPDNSLPSTPPPQIKPGYLLILARGTDGKWHYAAAAPGSAPPKPLPEPPKPDQGLPVDPEAPPAPDQTLPPIAAPV